MAKEQEITEELKKEPFGELIKEARKSKNLSVKELAADLNLSPSVIENLESEQFSELPPPMFVRGYIRAVSQYLGLDTEVLLHSYNQHGFSDPSLTKNTSPDSEKSSGVNLKPLFIFMKWLLVLVILSAALWFGFTKWQDAQKKTAETDALPLTGQPTQSSLTVNALSDDTSVNLPMPNVTLNPSISQVSSSAVTQNSEVAESALTGSSVNTSTDSNGNQQTGTQNNTLLVKPEPSESVLSEPVNQNLLGDALVEGSTGSDEQPPALPEKKKGVFIKPFGDSWIKVVDGRGKVLLSRLLKRNQERTLVGTPPYSLSIGNANKVKLEYNGKAFDHARYIDGRNVAKFKLN